MCRVTGARRTLEADRNERLTVVNAGIAERRQAAQTRIDADRAAVQGDVEAATANVVARAAQLATGKVPSTDTVQSAVSASMMEGASR